MEREPPAPPNWDRSLDRPLQPAKPSPDLDELARAEVYGAALRTGLAAGDPIRRGNIVKAGRSRFPADRPAPGARAIAIPVATGGASTGLLFPGDRVDIILTQTFKNNTPLMRRSVSETVVESLRVLAVDAANVKPAAASNGFGRTVTLEVTPEQAEKINVATELGKLSLTLRGVSGSDQIIASSMADAAQNDGDQSRLGQAMYHRRCAARCRRRRWSPRSNPRRNHSRHQARNREATMIRLQHDGWSQ